jgi:HEAT repeats
MPKLSPILDRPRNRRGHPMTPDEMIERLLRPSSDADGGVVANELLAAFCRDYPIENLRKLFVPATTGYAAFLASELGQKVRPLLREVAELLEDGTPRVRGDAIEAISLCTTWEDGWAIAKIVRMLGDPHEGVRWMACRALRYMESSQVLAGLEYLRESEPTSIFASFKNAFLAQERWPERASATLGKLLTHEDAIARRFGVAMAVRPRLFIDPALIALATTTKDAEVLKVVREATDAPLPPWAVWTGANSNTD